MPIDFKNIFIVISKAIYLKQSDTQISQSILKVLLYQPAKSKTKIL